MESASQTAKKMKQQANGQENSYMHSISQECGYKEKGEDASLKKLF